MIIIIVIIIIVGVKDLQIDFFFNLFYFGFICLEKKTKRLESFLSFFFWLFISKSISATCIHDETQQRACNRATHSLFFLLILSVLSHFRNTFFYFSNNKKKTISEIILIHILLNNTECLSKKMVNII